MSNYSEACTEVSIILSFLKEEDYNKIPLEIIEAIEENKDLKYIFNYDENVELRKQKLLKETRAILFNLYRDYLSTLKQKDIIINMQNEERNKLNEQKKLKYNVNQIFKDNTRYNTMKNEVNENGKITSLIRTKKENFFVKILNKIKLFFLKKE